MMWRYGGGLCPFCNGTGGFGSGGVMMVFFGLLVFAGVVLLIIWAIRQGEQRGHEYVSATPAQRPEAPSTDDAAIATARHRYATGEITKEQLDEIIATLRERR